MRRLLCDNADKFEEFFVTGNAMILDWLLIPLPVVI